MSDDGPFRLPIDGLLDLHAFAPADAGSVVDDYLDACRTKGVLEVRIVHGKGTGTLRRIVHGRLRRRRDVARWRLAGDASGWGATLVTLRRHDYDRAPCAPASGTPGDNEHESE